MYTEVTTWRHVPLVNPHLEVWEWQIPAYLFLGGLVAGLMILNALWRMQGRTAQGRAVTLYGAIAAPVLLSLGMLFLFLDLSNRENVFRFYMVFRPSSPMSWGAWILIAVYPVQILLLALPGGLEQFGGRLTFLNRVWEWIKRFALKVERPVLWLAVILGVGLGVYTGILLSVNVARPLWNTGLLGPLFLISGLSAGSAFVMLAKPTELEAHSAARWDAGLLIAEIAFLSLVLVNLATGLEPQQQAASLLLGGAFTPSFWIFVVILGALMPLWLEMREITRKPTPSWLAPTLVLIGGFALRYVLVVAGQVSHIAEVTAMCH
ncbi:MAG: NrfD/PsrC family molybdoenzyme membrane anchor subunit [bacterium]